MKPPCRGSRVGVLRALSLAAALFSGGCSRGCPSESELSQEELRWVTDSRGSGSGHLEHSHVDPVTAAISVEGYRVYTHPSGRFVLYTGPDSGSAENIYLKDTRKNTTYTVSYLPLWRKAPVSTASWTQGGGLYFEQQNAGRRLTAQCLIDLERLEFQYVRVAISDASKTK
jgi:hypothetical protein